MSIGGFARFNIDFKPVDLGEFLVNLSVVPKSFISGHGLGEAVFGFYSGAGLVCFQDAVGFNGPSYFSRLDGFDYFFSYADFLPVASKLMADRFVSFELPGFVAEYSSYSDHDSSFAGDYVDSQRLSVSKGVLGGFFKFDEVSKRFVYDLKLISSECSDSWSSSSETCLNWDFMYDFIKKNL